MDGPLWSAFPASLAAWLVPPAAGALIGFATNVIAIKMLFRPLRELRVLGLRLPFTPGILPRERHTLALSIGSMAEKYLLTEDLIRQRLDDAEFRSRILTQLARASGRVFSCPLNHSPWFAPRGEAPSDAAKFFARLIRLVLDSPLLDDAACSLSASLLAKNRGKTLRAVLGKEKSCLLVKKLAGLASPGSGSVSAALGALLVRQYPRMVRSLITLLRSQTVHEELESQGRIFLSGAILKLNAMQRFFVSAGQYDRTLSERMGEIVDDFIDQLETGLDDPAMGERVIRFLLAGAAGFSEKTSEIPGALLEAPLAAFLDKTIDEALALVLPLFASGAAETCGNPSSEQEAGRLLAALLRGKGGDEPALALTLDGFLQRHGEDSLSGLLSLDGDKKAALDRKLANVLLEGAKERAGGILATLDIKTIVAAKIDALDMLEVEKLILDIMAGKLKWIDIFGGILGALIGLVQVLLSNFVPW
jgi:hypothetical protein